jgi:hypothetical protein
MYKSDRLRTIVRTVVSQSHIYARECHLSDYHIIRKDSNLHSLQTLPFDYRKRYSIVYPPEINIILNRSYEWKHVMNVSIQSAQTINGFNTGFTWPSSVQFYCFMTRSVMDSTWTKTVGVCARAWQFNLPHFCAGITCTVRTLVTFLTNCRTFPINCPHLQLCGPRLDKKV